MNERIRQLAEQSGLPKYITREIGPTVMQKFAELLIRECAEFIAPIGEYCGGHGEPSAPSSRECAIKLKQRFGVEE